MTSVPTGDRQGTPQIEGLASPAAGRQPPAGRRIDINADAGESEDESGDLRLLETVSSVSLACGVHAGGPATIARLSAAALARGVGVGAHPGLRDGRKTAAVPPADAKAIVRDQVAAFRASTRAPLQHVKLHGALYHAARDPAVARAVVEVCLAAGVPLLVAQAGSPLEEAARAASLAVSPEAFLDRAYRPDGLLVPRGTPGAVTSEPSAAAARALDLALRGRVVAVDGTVLSITAATLCVHGDSPGAYQVAVAARRALEAAGVRIRPMGAR